MAKLLDNQLIIEGRPLDERAVMTSEELEYVPLSEGMTFYDKEKKEFNVVSKVSADGLFEEATKLLDSTSEEGLRKLIADTSTGLIQMVEDACSGFKSQIEQTAEGLRVEIGKAVEDATGLDPEQQQLLADLNTLDYDDLVNVAA